MIRTLMIATIAPSRKIRHVQLKSIRVEDVDSEFVDILLRSMELVKRQATNSVEKSSLSVVSFEWRVLWKGSGGRQWGDD
jgi:hypothetical protein